VGEAPLGENKHAERVTPSGSAQFSGGPSSKNVRDVVVRHNGMLDEVEICATPVSTPGRVQTLEDEHTGNGALNPVTGLQLIADGCGGLVEPPPLPPPPPHPARSTADTIKLRFAMSAISVSHVNCSWRYS